MSVKIELSKPVMSEGAEIKSLEFREPIGEDIVACGYPVRIIMGSATDPDVAVGEQKYDVNVTVATKLAARRTRWSISSCLSPIFFGPKAISW